MENRPKWYHKNVSLVLSFLVAGPFMLPLVWFNPRFSAKSKICITTVIIFFTMLLTAFFVKTMSMVFNMYEGLLKL
ncbi:MAG: hypothetical protein FJZ15_00710 [Candidatus Omnitrophica bacterium]|nr:hypothetical protein [Candidatus Omnitrophota bacterium]